MNKKIYIPIEDHPDLVRDYTTCTEVNTYISALGVFQQALHHLR